MSEDIILKVDNVSKQYRLGLVGTGTLSHDLNRWWHIIRGKEDPYLRIGDSNDRSTKGSSDYVWALKNITFDVKKGEVLGIIGKNGAGKSTLLKILSKVTGPTTGKIKTRGRIASLLEVGTGFHPELTGRENIFLNGAILGMTKKEIRSKIDEIVEFSGCERYIDTPVKRYSSGMTVRLAFAVAAHLEPEILVVDEVLAVGDAEFQKKAIGKMQDISKGEGRTVLFVSHNLVAVQNLCTRGILLENGEVKCQGEIEDVLLEYKRTKSSQSKILKKNDAITYTGCSLLNEDDMTMESDLNFRFEFENHEPMKSRMYLDVAVKNEVDEFVLHFKMDYTSIDMDFNSTGKKTIDLNVTKPNLLPGEYSIDLYLYDQNGTAFFWMERTLPFVIKSENSFTEELNFTKIKVRTMPRYEFVIS